MGEKGGSCPKAMRDRSRTVGVPALGVLAEAVTLGLSSVPVKTLRLKSAQAVERGIKRRGTSELAAPEASPLCASSLKPQK
jgi:hypothetical protein